MILLKIFDKEKEDLPTRYNRLMTFGRDWIGAGWATYIKVDPTIGEKTHQATIDAALQSRSTISGTQPKLLGVIQNGELRPANYWESSTHIVKLPNEKMPGLMEYEYMSIVATQALLPEDRCIKAQLTKLHLREEAPRDVLALERFYRTAVKNGKIHFEEMNQILGKPCIDRCEGDYMEIANAIREKMGNEGVKQFYARLLGQFLLNNTDNHFKNFALMQENGEWKMTPNYDLAPAAMYRLNDESRSQSDEGGIGRTTKARDKGLVLGIRGIARGQDKQYHLLGSEKLTIDDLNARVMVRLGRQFGLNSDDIREVIERITAAIPAAKEAVMNDPAPLLEQPIAPLIKSRRIYGDANGMNLKQDFCDRMEKRGRQLFGGIAKELPLQTPTSPASATR